MYNYTSLSLFPEYEQAANKDLVKIKAKERWGERKNKNFGLELCSGAKFCGKYGIPQINAYNDGIPKRFITFSEITSMGSPYIGVTSSDYDYVLEELWNNPQTYTATLAKYKCFAVPDFSLRVGDPLSVQIANTYRNHAIAYYMQEHGVKIMPAPSWASTPSFEFCFDGYVKGGVVLVSTIGALRDERSVMYFINGFKEMLKRLSPDAVVLYGDVNDAIQTVLPSQLYVVFANHERYSRARYGK